MNADSPASGDFEELLREVPRAGVYRLPVGVDDKVIAAAQACGYMVFRVDLARARNKDEMLAAIGRDMAFPEWFGTNWDALADCLTDLGWRPAEGYLVLLVHCDALQARAPNDLAVALRVFRQAADAWREQGIALWCLVGMQAEGGAGLPEL